MAALGLEPARVRGRRAWAVCPFHDDHDPTNFFVRTHGERAGNYHCFACKAGGDLTDLVVRMRGIKGNDDREKRKKARAFIEQAGKGYAPPRARVRVVARPAVLGRRRFELPPECIMNEPLARWVTPARVYAEGRGITQAEVDLYNLGYAVTGRLEGRIIFPVLAGPRALPAGYSARTFVDAERKYLTPHETEDADLDAMFGEHLWPPPAGRDVVVVTEGAINALSATRATGHPASSISGSDVRPGHIVKIATFRTVVVLTDPDKAGVRAARGIASSLGRHTNVVRPRLPPGQDARDVEKRDPAELKDIIVRARLEAALAS